MLNVRQILVSAAGLALIGVALTACGQRGPLFLPTDPGAKGRATLTDFVRPAQGPAPAASAPASAPRPAASAPARVAPAIPAASAPASAPAGGAPR